MNIMPLIHYRPDARFLSWRCNVSALGKTRSLAIRSLRIPARAAFSLSGFVAFAQELLGFQSSQQSGKKAAQRLGVDSVTLTVLLS